LLSIQFDLSVGICTISDENFTNDINSPPANVATSSNASQSNVISRSGGISEESVILERLQRIRHELSEYEVSVESSPDIYKMEHSIMNDRPMEPPHFDPIVGESLLDDDHANDSSFQTVDGKVAFCILNSEK
jgi:hypothetical protein